MNIDVERAEMAAEHALPDARPAARGHPGIPERGADAR
jgi:hypothetical protein